MSSETSSSFEVSRTLDTYCLNQILDNRSLESSGESWNFLKYLVPDAFLNTVFNQCIKRFPTLKRAKQTSCFYWKKTYTVSKCIAFGSFQSGFIFLLLASSFQPSRHNSLQSWIFSNIKFLSQFHLFVWKLCVHLRIPETGEELFLAGSNWIQTALILLNQCKSTLNYITQPDQIFYIFIFTFWRHKSL